MADTHTDADADAGAGTAFSPLCAFSPSPLWCPSISIPLDQQQTIRVHVEYAESTAVYFDACAATIRRWVQNGGGTVVNKPANADVQVRFLVHDPARAVSPYIAVSTEQPSSPVMRADNPATAAFFSEAQWVWCMDAVDASYIHAVFRVPASRIAHPPVMLSTALRADVVQAALDATAAVPKVDVLHVGLVLEGSRRHHVLRAITSLLHKHGHTVTHADGVFGADLHLLLSRARVVVVPHYYTGRVTYGLHRLAQLLAFPDLHVVVETTENDAEYAPRAAAWLRAYPSAFTLVSTADLPRTVLEVAEAAAQGRPRRPRHDHEPAQRLREALDSYAVCFHARGPSSVSAAAAGPGATGARGAGTAA